MLRRLAEMPFLNRLELVALTGRSRGAVYTAMDRLQQRGMVDAIPHASPLITPTSRYHLTAEGLRGLADDEGLTVDQLLDTRAVSARWRRVLLERLDVLAVIYRVAAVVSDAVHPIRFRWYRAGLADAGIVLPGGRCIAVVRQGNTADRTTFAKRLWRLSEEARPGAVLLLAPDDVRLRQASRALDSLPLLGFLAVERDAARGGAGSQVWRTPSGPVPLCLREVLDYLRPGGELPGQTPPRRESLPADLDLDSAANDVPTCLLPALLKLAEKRALALAGTGPPGTVDGSWAHQALPGFGTSQGAGPRDGCRHSGDAAAWPFPTGGWRCWPAATGPPWGWPDNAGAPRRSSRKSR